MIEGGAMEGCDLSFEYTEVTCSVSGKIDSVKNPLAGSTVVADAFGEIILDENRRDDGKAAIMLRSTKNA